MWYLSRIMNIKDGLKHAEETKHEIQDELEQLRSILLYLIWEYCGYRDQWLIPILLKGQ